MSRDRGRAEEAGRGGGGTLGRTHCPHSPTPAARFCSHLSARPRLVSSVPITLAVGHFYKKRRTSLAAQWFRLCFTTGDVGSILVEDLRFCRQWRRAIPTPTKKKRARLGWGSRWSEPQTQLRIQTRRAPPPSSACSLSGQPLPQRLPIYAQAPP